MNATTINAPRTSFMRKLAWDPLIWLILGIVILGSLTSPYYLTLQNFDTLMRSMAVIGLLALGVTVVLLTGRIDLSVAAIMIFSVILAVVLTNAVGEALGLRWLVKGSTFVGSSWIFVALTILIGGLAGLVNGIGVAWLKVSSFIMTLVMLTALRGGNFILSSGRPYYLQTPAIDWIGTATIFGVPFSFWVFLAVLVFLAWLIGATTFGRRIYAVGGNEKAAAYAGLKTDRYVLIAFVISGLCSAIAGVIFTARLRSVDAPLASGYELTAIAIAVIGGTALSGGIGSPWRTLLGAMAFAGGLNLLSIWGIGTWYQNLAVGLALLVAVGLSPASRQKIRL
ncbi:ABC transporter permease [Yoonia sp.]|uniref:ABC transporter permease n=1 Tax=Yoonia sp. TaxID=2212373 RepID=UPI002DFDB6AB|nr:ABC transporter permease [Yoonia sp.]